MCIRDRYLPGREPKVLPPGAAHHITVCSPLSVWLEWCVKIFCLRLNNNCPCLPQTVQWNIGRTTVLICITTPHTPRTFLNPPTELRNHSGTVHTTHSHMHLSYSSADWSNVMKKRFHHMIDAALASSPKDINKSGMSFTTGPIYVLGVPYRNLLYPLCTTNAQHD